MERKKKKEAKQQVTKERERERSIALRWVGYIHHITNTNITYCQNVFRLLASYYSRHRERKSGPYLWVLHQHINAKPKHISISNSQPTHLLLPLLSFISPPLQFHSFLVLMWGYIWKYS